MKKLINFLDKRFYLVCFAVLSGIAVFNALNFIGLWSDGIYWLCEFFDQKIHLDHGRLFTHIILHLPTLIFKILNINNLNLLIILHGFWAYISTVLCLIVLYLSLPKDKQDWFVFPLLSYLICMIFTSYYIFHDSHLTAGLFWIILSIYFFSDFAKISSEKLLCLLIVSFISIRAYQTMLFFAPLLLLIGIPKWVKAKNNINLKTNFLLLTSFVFLIASFIYSYYYTVNPTQYNINEYINSFNALKSAYFIFFIAVCVLTIISKNIYMIFISIFLLIAINIKFILNNNLILIYANNMRILNLIIPLIFAALVICLKYSTANISFKKYKVLILLLLIIFTINSFLFSTKINMYFKDMSKYLREYIGISGVSNFVNYLPETNKFLTSVDTNSLFEQSIIVKILYNNSNIIDSMILSDSVLENYRIVRYNNIINKLNKSSNIILH